MHADRMTTFYNVRRLATLTGYPTAFFYRLDEVLG